MVKKQLIVGVILLLVSLLVVGCGVPQEEHDAAVAERDAAQDEVLSLQSDLDKAESQIAGLEGDVAEAESQIEDLESDVAEAQTDIEALESSLSSAQTQIESLRSNLAVMEEQLGRMEAVFGELLFFDDFEDGDTEGWDFRGAENQWTTCQEDNNTFLTRVEPEGGSLPDVDIRDASIIGSYDWTDYTLEFRISVTQVKSGIGLWVDFRATPDLLESYSLGIFGNSVHGINISKGSQLIAQSNLTSSLSGWNSIKVEVYGDSIKVYVNELLKLLYTDSEPLEGGGINFKVDQACAKIYLDDVIVTRAK